MKPRQPSMTAVCWTLIIILALVMSAACTETDSGNDGNSADDDDDFDDDDSDDDSGDDDVDDDDIDDDDDDDAGPPPDCEGDVEYPESPEIIRGPYLQHVTQTSIKMMWETDGPGNSIIKWGPTEDLGWSFCHFDETPYHEVELVGLEPGSAQYYVVRSNGAQSDMHSFATAASPEMPYSYAVYGDSRSDPEQHRIVADSILEGNPDFVINVGDIVADGTVFEQYDVQHFGPAADLLAEKPMYVSIGNHEREAQYFYDLLGLPDEEKYFTHTYGNTRFIAINTNRLYLEGTPQYEWMEQELINARQDPDVEWIVVYAHHPAYSEGWDSPGYTGEWLMRFSVVPLMEEYGVDVFFCGHTHDYERGELNGVTHIITGGGGAALDSFQQDFEHILVYESAYHYVYVEVDGPVMLIEARRPDGTIMDESVLYH